MTIFIMHMNGNNFCLPISFTRIFFDQLFTSCNFFADLAYKIVSFDSIQDQLTTMVV